MLMIGLMIGWCRRKYSRGRAMAWAALPQNRRDDALFFDGSRGNLVTSGGRMSRYDAYRIRPRSGPFLAKRALVLIRPTCIERKLSMSISTARYGLVLALALGSQALLQPAMAQTASVIQLAGCDAGDKIDKTTVEQTKKRVEAAGYTQVKDLKKGCDNVWHGTAVNKDGVGGNVMVTPQGEVMPEGN